MNRLVWDLPGLKTDSYAMRLTDLGCLLLATLSRSSQTSTSHQDQPTVMRKPLNQSHPGQASKVCTCSSNGQEPYGPHNGTTCLFLAWLTSWGYTIPILEHSSTVYLSTFVYYLLWNCWSIKAKFIDRGNEKLLTTFGPHEQNGCQGHIW